jgi:hypothetical protein
VRPKADFAHAEAWRHPQTPHQLTTITAFRYGLRVKNTFFFFGIEVNAARITFYFVIYIST